MAKNTRVKQRVKFLGTSAPCLGCWSVFDPTNALTDSLKEELVKLVSPVSLPDLSRQVEKPSVCSREGYPITNNKTTASSYS